MRCNVGAAVRSAVEVDSPPVSLGSIRARAATLTAGTRTRREPAPLAVIAAMLLIGVLTFVMIDRAFMAPSSSGTAASAPMPSPTMT